MSQHQEVEIRDNLKTDTLDHADAFKTELEDSLKHTEAPALLPGQKVNVKVFVMSVGNDTAGRSEGKEETVPAGGQDGGFQVEESAEGSQATEATYQTVKNLSLSPQRKISRFLVSPVLSGQLDLPQDKPADADGNEQKVMSGKLCHIYNGEFSELCCTS